MCIVPFVPTVTKHFHPLSSSNWCKSRVVAFSTPFLRYKYSYTCEILSSYIKKSAKPLCILHRSFPFAEASFYSPTIALTRSRLARTKERKIAGNQQIILIIKILPEQIILHIYFLSFFPSLAQGCFSFFPSGLSTQQDKSISWRHNRSRIFKRRGLRPTIPCQFSTDYFLFLLKCNFKNHCVVLHGFFANVFLQSLHTLQTLHTH